MTEAREVRAGQVWEDTDKRMKGRTVLVQYVEGERAVCTVLTQTGGAADPRGETVRILIRRMRPTSSGWRFVSDANGDPS